MGWLFTKKTKDQLVATLVASSGNDNVSNEVLEHHLVGGSVLWSLVRLTVKKDGLQQFKKGEALIFIRCDLLDQQDGSWGYKAAEESMHPYAYSCLVHYLDLAPKQSEQWRERVRRFHAGEARSETETETKPQI